MGPVEALILVLVILWVPAILVTAMKERWILFALSVVIFPVSYLGAMMAAKPGSWWERRQARLAAKSAARKPPA